MALTALTRAFAILLPQTSDHRTTLPRPSAHFDGAHGFVGVACLDGLRRGGVTGVALAKWAVLRIARLVVARLRIGVLGLDGVIPVGLTVAGPNRMNVNSVAAYQLNPSHDLTGDVHYRQRWR